MSELTHERLLELLHYEPESGVFTWRVERKKCSAGKRAGYRRPDGYRTLTIDYDSHLEGRLAWFYMTGKWPNSEIDHHDLNPSNSKLDNLREATRTQNQCNVRRRNTTGFKGVKRAHQRKEAYTAGLYIAGKYKHIGTFPTAKAASEAFAKAAAITYGEYARHE